ncbi:hypothetical protein ABZ345_19395 [Lentzea sp. NPDC005914]|uniref:hypothetical protein n=1 Tax=Lentzea sp. NPDC005914 TaxID=3154572 RepID=UPI0033C2D0D1
MLKRAFFVMPALGFGLAALVGCSTAMPDAAPVPITTSTSSSAAAPTSSNAVAEKPQAVAEKPVVEKRECAINPADAQVPAAEPYSTLPAAYGVQIKIAGVPEVVKAGKPVEVEVTLCNNSPAAYPKAGLVFGLSHCGCASGPVHMPTVTAQRFDAARGSWVELEHPAAGTGMDYLDTSTNQQPLPKGKSVTVRYRFTLDKSMGDGDGGIFAAAVTPDGPVKISEVSVPFAVRH